MSVVKGEKPQLPLPISHKSPRESRCGSMDLPLKPRSRQGFMCLSFPERNDGFEPLEDIFSRLEASQRPRSQSESLDCIMNFSTEKASRWHIERALGNGASGHVDLMRDREGNRYAVKKMRLTNRRQENRQIVRDLEFVLRVVQNSPNDHIVQFHGYVRWKCEVWIVMEVMDSCFAKLLAKQFKSTATGLAEDLIGCLCVSVVKALHDLKVQHQMIHRDVRPTNILVDRNGFIKLCDFGISRVLVNSLAHTADAGCLTYLAPERIGPSQHEYGIKSDIWSLGVTIVELAAGRNPYADCKGYFETGTRICSGPPPRLPVSFSEDARHFVSQCLVKDADQRPNYDDLKRMSFYRKYENFDPEVVSSCVRHLLADEL